MEVFNVKLTCAANHNEKITKLALKTIKRLFNSKALRFSINFGPNFKTKIR